MVSYTLTGSRLLTADESLRRQQSPGGATHDDEQRQRRRRRLNSTVDSPHPNRHRHLSSASPVQLQYCRSSLALNVLWSTNRGLIIRVEFSIIA